MSEIRGRFPTWHSFAPGVRVAHRYVLISPLRSSTATRAFLAHDPQSGRDTTIVFVDRTCVCPRSWDAFSRVIAAANAVRVRGLVLPSHLMDSPPDPPHFITKLQVGRGLDHILEDGAIHPERALGIVTRAAEILHRVHSMTGVSHRSLTPAQLVVSIRGDVNVLDYGVAEFELGGANESHYRAPEQDDGLSDQRSDVYTLGVILRELLVGHRLPRQGAPHLRALIAVPRSIDELVTRMIFAEPTMRPNLATLCSELRQILGWDALSAPDSPAAAVTRELPPASPASPFSARPTPPAWTHAVSEPRWPDAQEELKSAALLRDLLCRCFDEEQLRRWLHAEYGEEIANDLPGSIASLYTLAHDAVWILRRRGVPDDDVLDRIARIRPSVVPRDRLGAEHNQHAETVRPTTDRLWHQFFMSSERAELERVYAELLARERMGRIDGDHVLLKMRVESALRAGLRQSGPGRQVLDLGHPKSAWSLLLAFLASAVLGYLAERRQLSIMHREETSACVEKEPGQSLESEVLPPFDEESSQSSGDGVLAPSGQPAATSPPCNNYVEICDGSDNDCDSVIDEVIFVVPIECEDAVRAPRGDLDDDDGRFDVRPKRRHIHTENAGG